MIYQQLICPRCRRLLTVADSAPPLITCPRCLERIERATAEPAPERALPVIPVEEQADRDAKFSTSAIWLAGSLVCIGVVIAFVQLGGARGGLPCMVIGFAGVAMLVFWLRSARGDRALADESAESEPPPIPTAVPGRPGVLEYRAPARDRRPGMSLAAFAGGFFAAILVCGLGFGLLASTASDGGRSARTAPNLHGLYLGVVVLAVIATAMFGGVLNRRRGWRGIGPGVAVGLCLGLLALGPCALCYMTTL